MDFAAFGRFAHLAPCFLGSLSNQEHNREGFTAFESKLANDQKERSLASLVLTSRKAGAICNLFLSSPRQGDPI